MKYLVKQIVTILFFSLFPFNSTKAVEPLLTNELSSHCAFYKSNPESKDAIFCVRFIQGFISGAIIADERIAANLAIATYSPKFCLGSSVSLKTVAINIIKDLENDSVSTNKLAREAVYHSLRNNYPCEFNKKINRIN